MTGNEQFGTLEFEQVIKWMLPAFPMVKNKNSMGTLTICCISLLANAIKRKGDCKWDESAKEKLKNWNLLRGAETYDDMRLNLIIVGEPGSGKTALMTGISNLNPYKCEFRKSQPNYDQMIGSTEKWLEAGSFKYETFPGELSCDIYMMDEVLSVYLDDSRENKKIRELLRAALSRIGTNKITKPQVRIPDSYQCSYYPECTLVQGFQPRKVPVSLITEGDLRRAQIITADFPLKEKEKTFRFGSESPDSSIGGTDDKKYTKAKEYLKYLRQKRFEIWIPSSTAEYVKKCMVNLRVFSGAYGHKAQWYYKTAYFDIESQLIRYGVVMSIVKDSTKETVDVTIDDIKDAFPYYSTAFSESLLWLNKYTHGDFTGITSREAEADRILELAKMLQDKGAFSALETTVEVTELKEFMVKKGWFSTVNGAKRFYQNMMNNGIIMSGQKNGIWFVWLGLSGKEILERQGFEVPW